ncbi:hypothetical protein D5045_00725 [Verminephrobacter eiseniae]|nr:hypothetical protein [Verminephrobacter eiseniae]
MTPACMKTLLAIPCASHRAATPLLTTLAFAAMLAACGGSGGATGSAGIDPSALKGRWITPSNEAPAMTAVILPDASDQASAWMLAHDSSELVKLLVRSDGSVNGMAYALHPGNAAGQAVAGQVTAALTASPKRISFSGVKAKALALDQSDAMSLATVQANAAGSWSATTGDKARITQWTVAASGDMAGSTTTGCNHTGNLAAMAHSSAYTVQFDERCLDGSHATFRGIATINRSKNRLTVAATTVDAARGIAVFFSQAR